MKLQLKNKTQILLKGNIIKIMINFSPNMEKMTRDEIALNFDNWK